MDSADELLRDSVIPEFYANKTIFVTGGTGYLGKLLIEKLLRSCPDVKEILILIRPKKNKSVEERITILRNIDLLESVRQIDPNLPLKIQPVAGDITEDYFGLNAEDLERVINSVNIFIHLGAAAVFEAELKYLVQHNVIGVNNAINVANKIKNLIAFINVSSILSVYKDGQIEEKIYPTKYPGKNIMDLVNGFDHNILNKITPDLKKEFINIYGYTKAVADNLIQERCQHLPVGIYRPPGVGPLHKEPIPGWMDYIGASNGVGLGIVTGIVRVYTSTPSSPVYIIPGEYAINCLIAIGWDIAQRPNGITVYNYVDNFKPTVGTFIHEMLNMKYPLELAFRYPSTWLISTKSEKLHDIILYVFNTVPALIWDKIFAIFGLNYNLQKAVGKLNKMLNTVAGLANTRLVFQMENTEKLWQSLSDKDKQIFHFDLSSIDWIDYMRVGAIGMKTITLKEDMANVDKARRKQIWLMFQHYAWILILLISGSIIYKLRNKL